MRHTPEELSTLLTTLSDPIHFGLSAGLRNARSTNAGAFAPHKKSLLSHLIRSDLFDYLSANPIDGFTLLEKDHCSNQCVVLRHESGLIVRIGKCTTFSKLSSSSLSTRSNAYFAQPTLFPTDSSPGTVAIVWDRRDGKDEEEFQLTAYREAIGGNLYRGEADFALRLEPTRPMIPSTSFDPNQFEQSSITVQNRNVSSS